MDDIPRRLNILPAATLNRMRIDLEERIVEARRAGDSIKASFLQERRGDVRIALEQVLEVEQARKEGARPTKCRHGVSMADNCLKCREEYSAQKAVEQKRDQVERDLRLYQGIERLRAKQFTPAAQEQSRLEWTPIFKDEADSLDYQGIARSSQLAEYWNRPDYQAAVAQQAGLSNAAKPVDPSKLTRDIYEDALRAAATKPNPFATFVGGILGQRAAPRVQVRRAPATVAAGPPMDAKRGYFDE